jgi:hypothetical protein
MPYQGVVLGVLVGVALAFAAVLYIKGKPPLSYNNRSRNTGGPLPTAGVPSWELG